MNSIAKLSRRRVLRGMMGGAAVTVGLPFLDCFLDSNGTALAPTGTPLPVCFGTWFYGCGLNPGSLGTADGRARITNSASSFSRSRRSSTSSTSTARCRRCSTDARAARTRWDPR